VLIRRYSKIYEFAVSVNETLKLLADLIVLE